MVWLCGLRQIGSGGCVWSVGLLPDFFPAPAGLLAAQGEDAGGAGHGPVHAGEFEALPDDGLAAGLDDAGADEQAAGAEVAVAHPGGVGLEVGQGLVPVGGFDAGQGEDAGGGCDGADVAGVELGAAFVEPFLAAVSPVMKASILPSSCRCSRA